MENEKHSTRRKNRFFKKKLGISKIVFQSFTTTVQKHIVNKLEKVQIAFLEKTLLLR